LNRDLLARFGKARDVRQYRRKAIVLTVDLAAAGIGFVISFGWGKSSAREMDRDAEVFLDTM